MLVLAWEENSRTDTHRLFPAESHSPVTGGADEGLDTHVGLSMHTYNSSLSLGVIAGAIWVDVDAVEMNGVGGTFVSTPPATPRMDSHPKISKTFFLFFFWSCIFWNDPPPVCHLSLSCAFNLFFTPDKTLLYFFFISNPNRKRARQWRFTPTPNKINL